MRPGTRPPRKPSGEGTRVWWAHPARGVGPPERVVVVAAERYRLLRERELADVPAANVIVQPENRGTAPGVLSRPWRVDVSWIPA
jgi:hypothetical protein